MRNNFSLCTILKCDISCISNKNNEVYDFWIEIPYIDEVFYPLIEIIPIQLLAYYAALEKNTDPDYPRNLAKSVTVK